MPTRPDRMVSLISFLALTAIACGVWVLLPVGTSPRLRSYPVFNYLPDVITGLLFVALGGALRVLGREGSGRCWRLRRLAGAKIALTLSALWFSLLLASVFFGEDGLTIPVFASLTAASVWCGLQMIAGATVWGGLHDRKE